jgi:hypothetical protein
VNIQSNCLGYLSLTINLKNEVSTIDLLVLLNISGALLKFFPLVLISTLLGLHLYDGPRGELAMKLLMASLYHHQ